MAKGKNLDQDKFDEYVAFSPNYEYIAYDKNLGKAIDKLKEQGYNGSPLVALILDPNKTYLFKAA